MLYTKKRVMIVDDDISNLNMVKRLLEKNGYCVTTSTNGNELLNFISKEKFEPDLILIDILMPIMSGYDVLRLLRERLSKNVKLVYETIVPRSDVDLKEADGFIQKPFEIQSFLKQIGKFTK